MSQVLTYDSFKIRNSEEVRAVLLRAGYQTHYFAAWLLVYPVTRQAYMASPPDDRHVHLYPDDLAQFLLMPTQESQKIFLQEIDKERPWNSQPLGI